MPDLVRPPKDQFSADIPGVKMSMPGMLLEQETHVKPGQNISRLPASVKKMIHVFVF